MLNLYNKVSTFNANWFFFLINNLKFKHILKNNNFFFNKRLCLLPKKIIFKKNIFPESIMLNLNKSKIHYNTFFLFYFKYFNLFNQLSKYTKTVKFFLNKKKTHKTVHGFYNSNLPKFDDSFFFLTGKLISKYDWNFLNKKKWNRHEPATSLKPNMGATGSQIFKNDFSALEIKKFYFNNYFYFNKVNFSYSELKYLCKLDTFQVKPNSFNSQTFKPYSFLDVTSRRDLTGTLIINFFKYYQRIFNVFRKSFSKILVFKNKIDLTFSRYSFEKSIEQCINTVSSENVINFLKFQYSSRAFFKNFNNNTEKVDAVVNRSFFNQKTALIEKNINNLKILKYYYFLRINKILLYKNINSLSKLQNVNLFFKFKNYKNINYKLKFKNFFFLLNITGASASDADKNLKFNKIGCWFTNFNFFKSTIGFKTLKGPYVVKNYKTIKKLTNLDKFVLFKTPQFSTNFETPFVLDKYAFVYLSNNVISFFDKAPSIANFKKNYFSFLLGNDLHRFIIKRYLKTQNLNYAPQQILPSQTLLYDNLFNNPNLTPFSNYHETFYYQSQLKSLKSELTDQYAITKNWFDRNEDLDYVENLNNNAVNYNIKRVKFKPGYMTLWRNARSSLQKILNLKLKYQHKLTNYLLKLLKFVKFKILLLNEMQLNNIILKSRLIPDKFYTDFFIKKGLTYLNGFGCFNPNTILYVGDFIQAIIHVKYYIIYKWLLNWSIKKKIKLKLKTKKKNSPARFNDEKIKSFLFPDWILTNKNILDDTSKFLEVDYFTLSIVILYEPFLLSEFNIYNFIAAKYGIINLYNWKYIT